METFFRNFEPYQRFDPAGWVNLFRIIPIWAGAVMIPAGVLMMLLGGGRMFRLVSGPLGAAVGLIWAPVLAAKLGFAPQADQVRIAATITIGGLGLLYPPAATFFAFGVPVGLMAGELVGANDWVLGFIPAFFFGGVLAMAAHRYVGALVSSLVGSWLLMLGLLAVTHPLTSMGESVAQQPWGVLSAAALFALAGCVYQLFVRLSPEAREALRSNRRLAKKKRAETEAIENRWANYSKDKGLD